MCVCLSSYDALRDCCVGGATLGGVRCEYERHYDRATWLPIVSLPAISCLARERERERERER